MNARTPSQTDYTQAIAAILATMPDERRMQVYEYALFLQLRSHQAGETKVQIEADESWWEAQFAATDDKKLAAFIAAAVADGETTGIAIKDGKLIPIAADDGR